MFVTPSNVIMIPARNIAPPIQGHMLRCSPAFSHDFQSLSEVAGMPFLQRRPENKCLSGGIERVMTSLSCFLVRQRFCRAFSPTRTHSVPYPDGRKGHKCTLSGGTVRTGSLPCELRLDARQTVAHTGGYLLLIRRPRGSNPASARDRLSKTIPDVVKTQTKSSTNPPFYALMRLAPYG